MTSSIAISMPFQETLDVFCTTNKVLPVTVAKLGFAAVLHQYFDLPEFTCAEAFPKDLDDHTRYSIIQSRQVQYSSELASSTSIRAAIDPRGTDLSPNHDLAPLLVDYLVSERVNGEQSSNRLTASLVIVKSFTTPIEGLLSSTATRHVSSPGWHSSHTSC